MSKTKYKYLKVTTTQLYAIPMHDEETTQINNWSIDEVIQDWFNEKNLNSSHASREGHHIKGTTQYVDSEFLDDLK